jgi:hypothetical protein
MKTIMLNFFSAVSRNTAANGKHQSHTRKTAFLAGICALASLPLTLLQAQSPAGTVVAMRVSIPFQFTAGDRQLPAGKYVVYANQHEHELVLRNNQQSVTVKLAASSAFRQENDASNGRLEFNDYGNAHVLKKVWQVGDNKAAVLPSTKHEQELAKLAAPVHVASVAAE